KSNAALSTQADSGVSYRLSNSGPSLGAAFLCGRQPTHDQAVEPCRKCSRILGHLAVENLCLLEQQYCNVRNISFPRLALGSCQRFHQNVTHVKLKDGLDA